MEQFLSHLIIAPLIIGFLLDALIGDPLWLPHPIRLFGSSISFLEKRMNRGRKRKFKGAVMSVSLIGFTFILFYFIFASIKEFNAVYILFASIGIFYGLANHSLIKEAIKVEKSLQNHGIDAARKQLSYIVGRETSSLNKNQIRKAVLETLAENLSDGVVAPLFFYALGGVPAMLTYKMVNTLDSMIGYKNDRFKDFGYFAAKTDDVFNFIPARLTAILMTIVSFSIRGFIFIFKYGNKHSSPNAGYPEAALSGILNVQFGGANIYHGETITKPLIGKNGRDISKKDISIASIINAAVATVSVILITLCYASL